MTRTFRRRRQRGPRRTLQNYWSAGRRRHGQGFQGARHAPGPARALKFLPDELGKDKISLERFQREAQAASALNHPNICTIYDTDFHDGAPFLVMELLEGTTLRDKIQEGPLRTARCSISASRSRTRSPPRTPRASSIATSSPRIFSSPRAGRPKFWILASRKLLRNSASPKVWCSPIRPHNPWPAETLLTSPGVALGTVAYMSPEQALGEDLDARTDLFSLGAVMYEMCTGRQAFTGQTSAAVFDAILNREPVSPSRLNPTTPKELERIICKSIEKDRNLRYQNANDLSADLARLKRDTQSAKQSVETAQTAARDADRGPTRRQVAQFALAHLRQCIERRICRRLRCGTPPECRRVGRPVTQPRKRRARRTEFPQRTQRAAKNGSPVRCWLSRQLAWSRRASASPGSGSDVSASAGRTHRLS